MAATGRRRRLGRKFRKINSKKVSRKMSKEGAGVEMRGPPGRHPELSRYVMSTKTISFSH